MLENPIKIAEIAAKCFGVCVEYEPDATPTEKRIARSNAFRVVHTQRKAGRFPRPSYTLPGHRGESVWLLETVETWQSEYFARCPKQPATFSTADKYAHRKACNAAAVEATKIAEAFDAELFNTHRDGSHDAVASA